MIHVASPFPAATPRDEMEVIGPAVDGTKNVLEACAKTKGGVKRVVLTSSCAAIYGKRSTQKSGYEHVVFVIISGKIMNCIIYVSIYHVRLENLQ